MARIDDLLEHRGLFHEMARNRRLELQGELFDLFLASNRHRGASLTDFAAAILPPVHFNQFRIYRDNKRAVGFVSWAYFSSQEAEGYMAGNFDFTVPAWIGGEHLWFIDFIAPYGHAIRMADDLKRNVFPNQVGFAPDLGDGNEAPRIRKFYGLGVSADDSIGNDRDFIKSLTR